MTAYPWPGNVRELENKVKVACLLGEDQMVSAADLGLAPGTGNGLPLNLKEVRNRAEREAVSPRDGGGLREHFARGRVAGRFAPDALRPARAP